MLAAQAPLLGSAWVSSQSSSSSEQLTGASKRKASRPSKCVRQWTEASATGSGTRDAGGGEGPDAEAAKQEVPLAKARSSPVEPLVEVPVLAAPAGWDDAAECSPDGVGVRAYECAACNKRFAQKSSAVLHFRSVHKGLADHQCYVCARSFASLVELRNHRSAAHGADRHCAPLRCELCARQFAQPQLLDKHVKSVHRRNYAVQCPICHKVLSQMPCLKTHLRTHTGEKKWPCDTCPKSFTDYSSLCRHRRLHAPAPPHRCRFCAYTSADGSNFRRHLRLKHPEQLAADPLPPAGAS